MYFLGVYVSNFIYCFILFWIKIFVGHIFSKGVALKDYNIQVQFIVRPCVVKWQINDPGSLII